jgi:hypothetical protein
MSTPSVKCETREVYQLGPLGHVIFLTLDLTIQAQARDRNKKNCKCPYTFRGRPCMHPQVIVPPPATARRCPLHSTFRAAPVLAAAASLLRTDARSQAGPLETPGGRTQGGVAGFFGSGDSGAQQRQARRAEAASSLRAP